MEWKKKSVGGVFTCINCGSDCSSGEREAHVRGCDDSEWRANQRSLLGPGDILFKECTVKHSLLEITVGSREQDSQRFIVTIIIITSLHFSVLSEINALYKKKPSTNKPY